MRYLLILFCCCCTLGLTAQTDSAFIRDNFIKMEVMVPMRDGAKLFTSIYIPKDTTRTYPILLKRTPYSCAPYGPDAYTQWFQNMYLARAGYIWATQDVRGRYMSEGEFVDVRPYNPAAHQGSNANGKTPVDEATDTYDTADWLLKNLSTNNGKIGVYGISYPGFYATMAILARHPAIKAVSPQAPVTDWFIGDDFHHNGVFFQMDAFAFYSGFGLPRPKPTTEGKPGFSDWKTPDNYDFYLKTGALRNFNEKYLQHKVPFWDDLMQHPNYDAWWKARNPRPHLRNIMPAVMTVGGLFDAEDCWGAWNTYKSIERQNPTATSNRVVMGPWIHGGWARTTGERLGKVRFGAPTSDYYLREVEFKFFEYYLKGKGDMALPEATVFETGSNRWTTYDAWPPANSQATAYYFGTDGNIATTPGRSSTDTYVSDPEHPVPYTEDVHLRRTNEYMCDDQRFASRRPDVLTYSTEPLTAPLTVTGTVLADLWVKLDNLQPGGSQQLDADFVVKLIDVFPDTLKTVEMGTPMGGYQMLVRGEIMRGRFRKSFEVPKPFAPGVWEEVKFELPDVAHTFLPGHKLMVQVQSSWFPLADRNPQRYVNIYEARDADFMPVRVTLSKGGQRASKVVLPVKSKL